MPDDRDRGQYIGLRRGRGTPFRHSEVSARERAMIAIASACGGIVVVFVLKYFGG